tara:strand:+ start:11288 stop:12082 length:795 start_codon:yes stop_codon:yes gene_type:complete
MEEPGMDDSKTSMDTAQMKNAALRSLALAASGRTGADIERLIREARQKARRQHRQLSYEHIATALTAGQTAMSPDLVWRIAVHESGHALAFTCLGIADVETISVGNGEGGFVESTARQGSIENETWLQNMLACVLAGRVAEKLIFGETLLGSGGSETSDLARATRLALDAETSLGYGKATPLLYRSANDHPSLLSLDRQLVQQVNNRLEAAADIAEKLLSGHRTTLVAVANRVAERKVIDGDEVRAVIGADMNAALENPRKLAP